MLLIVTAMCVSSRETSHVPVTECAPIGLTDELSPREWIPVQGALPDD